MIVHLIKGKELVEEEAVCALQESINQENGKQILINFEFKVENNENSK